MMSKKLLLVALFLFCGFVLANESYHTDLSREALEAEMSRLEGEIAHLKKAYGKIKEHEVAERRKLGKAEQERRQAEAMAFEAEFGHEQILERLQREAPSDPDAYLDWIEAMEREFSPHVAVFEERMAQLREREERGESEQDEAEEEVEVERDENGMTRREKLLEQWLSQIAPDRRDFYRIPSEDEALERKRQRMETQRRFRNQFSQLGGFEERRDPITLQEAREEQERLAQRKPQHPHERRRAEVNRILEQDGGVRLDQLRSRDLAKLARNVRRAEMAKQREARREEGAAAAAENDSENGTGDEQTSRGRRRRNKEKRDADLNTVTESLQLDGIADRKERRLAEQKLAQEKAEKARVERDLRMQELLQSDSTEDRLRGLNMLYARYERDLLDHMTEEEREAYEKEKGFHVTAHDESKPVHPPREALHEALRRREAAFEKLKRDIARLDQVRHLFDLRQESVHGHWTKD
mmetsp:Transcript_39528/g.99648  ORF Transcript_39528/g.99648 Transcript_39528/m.99648 type:complete len:469 (+) Transcript_39528:121-1527(+)|eukprot:CAMPEP_0177645426 /NCGR_PEP_ID=MMETSP0447-20121125/9240_1 /TAXON_ID=0 /ORGANISM="Stygamoeba regulata, Strain BSH-02190019" /LENGTH=468 /DNA_ID=CAMNT_0019147903 /DNA_START=77 /DNA_END=1483 /DNA_ORIENTATION=-